MKKSMIIPIEVHFFLFCFVNERNLTKMIQNHEM